MGVNNTLDDATLVRNLNAVCYGLANAINHGGYGGPPSLTTSDLEDYVPGAVFEVALAAGWLEKPDEFEEIDLDKGRAGSLGDHIVEAEYKAWFVSLIADVLAALNKKASQHEEAQITHRELMFQAVLAWHGANNPQEAETPASDNPAKTKIDEFFDKSQTVHTLQGLADEASKKKHDGDKYPVSRVTVSRIYNGFGAGRTVLHAVASVINELVPCTRDDLRAITKKKPTQR
jgi:hypothetical protein